MTGASSRGDARVRRVRRRSGASPMGAIVDHASTHSSPERHPACATPPPPSSTARDLIAVDDHADHDVAGRAATSAAVVSSALAPCSAAQRAGLAGSMRPDRQREAGAAQVGGHARAHDPKPQEAHALAAALLRHWGALFRACPNPPPPGARCAAALPAGSVPVILPGSSRSSRRLRPRAPGAPPWAPGGAWRRRSVISEKLISCSAWQLAYDALASVMDTRAPLSRGAARSA